MFIKTRSKIKLNLFLHIIGKDILHILESLFLPIDFGDDILIKIAKSNNIRFSGKYSLQVIENKEFINNIIDVLKSYFNIKDYFDIEIIKNIPVGAGIGGGTSDAVTIIKSILKYYNINIDYIELFKIFSHMGNDIYPMLHEKPVLFSKNNAYLVDNMPKLNILIIYPNINISTKDIFSQYHYQETEYQYEFNKNDIMNSVINANNQLENIVCSKNITIKELIQEIKSYHGCIIARMSGTGSTCFGIFHNNKDLLLAYNSFSKKYPDYFIITN